MVEARDQRDRREPQTEREAEDGPEDRDGASSPADPLVGEGAKHEEREHEEAARLARQTDEGRRDRESDDVPFPRRTRTADREGQNRGKDRHPEEDRQEVRRRNEVAAEPPGDGPERGRLAAAPERSGEQERSPAADEGRQENVEPEGELERQDEEKGRQRMEHPVVRIRGERLARREVRIPEGNARRVPPERRDERL